MKKIFKYIFIGLGAVLFFYMLIPGPAFPEPPPDSIRSREPADSESQLRRAYFTNFTRSEVVAWYKKEFDGPYFGRSYITSFKLNYGPEESQGIIRDQTRSTFLEEIVHPFRESLFINGFEPNDPKDDIFIEGQHWRQKIIVKYVPSIVFVRILVYAGIITGFALLFNEWKRSLGK